MTRYGLIFVLYRPNAEFVANLRHARAICADLVAVDNTPEPDAELHDALHREGLAVLVNRNRGGLAGAYNRGAEVLLARGCEVIFLLDQDSRIEATFFDGMMQACAQIGDERFVLGPRVYEVNLGKCMPTFPPGRRFPRPVRMNDHRSGLFPTLFVISSGSAISAAAYRALGAFREDYFIEYLDIEYGLRASSQGVPVYMNAAVTLEQTTGQIERHGKLYTTHHVAWRRYYGARNAVHCLRLYKAHWGFHWLAGALALHQGLCVALFEPDKRRKLAAIACGYWDGRRGRLGTFESLHPRLHAYCTGARRQTATPVAAGSAPGSAP
ncbi:glycosyltransferase [Lysobacter silvisoli]|uniref:Glycosyltransferase n=1 Tax=Lysobacter silvisoli TaxID=2293254 RepID=A0A371K000_9GAMM|nr:glycosyltransferase [Lysobacter silvisoli]RDZ27245.1 glycosyltransferase [Lysobacter silvisoli]